MTNNCYRESILAKSQRAACPTGVLNVHRKDLKFNLCKTNANGLKIWSIPEYEGAQRMLLFLHGPYFERNICIIGKIFVEIIKIDLDYCPTGWLWKTLRKSGVSSVSPTTWLSLKRVVLRKNSILLSGESLNKKVYRRTLLIS